MAAPRDNLAAVNCPLPKALTVKNTSSATGHGLDSAFGPTELFFSKGCGGASSNGMQAQEETSLGEGKSLALDEFIGQEGPGAAQLISSQGSAVKRLQRDHEAEIASLTQKVEDVRNEMANMQKDHVSQITSLKQEQITIDSAYSSIKKEIKEAHTTTTILRKDLSHRMYGVWVWLRISRGRLGDESCADSKNKGVEDRWRYTLASTGRGIQVSPVASDEAQPETTRFIFDHVYNERHSSRDVSLDLCTVFSEVVAGRTAGVISNGYSGSGKSHTILTAKGFAVALVMADYFFSLPDMDLTILASIVAIRGSSEDWCKPDPSLSSRGVKSSDISNMYEFPNSDSLRSFIDSADSLRDAKANVYNSNSSRKHLIIHVMVRNNGHGVAQTQTQGNLWLVDLAGNERAVDKNFNQSLQSKPHTGDNAKRDSRSQIIEDERQVLIKDRAAFNRLVQTYQEVSRGPSTFLSTNDSQVRGYSIHSQR